MKLVLEVAILLGGVAALWFFWDKIWGWFEPKPIFGRMSKTGMKSGDLYLSAAEKQPELEFKFEKYSIGTVTADSRDGVNPSLFAQVCITNKSEKTAPSLGYGYGRKTAKTGK